MAESSRGIRPSSSPDRIDPSQVDEREPSADDRAGNWLAMLPAAALVTVLWLPVFVVVRVFGRPRERG